MKLVDAFLTLTPTVLRHGRNGDFGQLSMLSSRNMELSNQSHIRLTGSASLSTPLPNKWNAYNAGITAKLILDTRFSGKRADLFRI